MRKILLFSILASSLFLNTASAQTCPGFPVRGVQIIDALYNPQLAFGDDDQRRSLTRTFIEQLVFEFPAEGWVWKSADPGRPPSKDSIAKLVAGRLCNWDWQNGTSRTRSVQAGQPGDDITGQNPILVPGINHLSAVPQPGPTPTPQPGPAPSAVDLTPVITRIETLYAQAERIFAAQEVEAAADRAAAQASQELLRQHVAETRSFFASVGNFFTNGKTIAAIVAGVGTFLGTQVTK